MKKFDEQVKEAKVKRLQYRIVRDIVFILLGITFLALSIYSAQKNKDRKTKKTNTTITTTVKKTK